MSSDKTSRSNPIESMSPRSIAGRLTRAQVATRLGTSVSTVRRYEGQTLHPEIDDAGVRWFDSEEVAKVASALANELGTGRRKPRNRNEHIAAARSDGEIAAQVFERFEQRQSLAEIVVGVRIEPEKVRELFQQWCVGLTEGQLLNADRKSSDANLPIEGDVARAQRGQLEALMAALPVGQVTRISIARHRGEFVLDGTEYMKLSELGGFHVAAPCGPEAITNRFGCGTFRITAYGFEPRGVRWEVVSTLASR
jgi:hypothetical protein